MTQRLPSAGRPMVRSVLSSAVSFAVPTVSSI
jgi:hypothetical protein